MTTDETARTPDFVGPSMNFTRLLAQDSHDEQVDKQGRDYFEHHVEPIAMSLAPLGAEAMMAGYLHDVVEDSNVTLDDLRTFGYPPSVINAVDAVTRRRGETYEDLIERACADPLGTHVKLADNTQNILSNPGLAAVDPAKAESLLHRYLMARDRLVVARERHDVQRLIRDGLGEGS